MNGEYSDDFCITGLGNPGFKYRNTRHNVGFMIIDALAERLGADKFELAENFIYSPVSYNSMNGFLVKPVTFMNLSGIAVKEFLDKTNLPLQNILVVFDDVNIPFGTIRIRPSGSDGGQKGIGSIIYELTDDRFPRLRFGIGNADEQEKFAELAGFVLSDFSDDENKMLDELIRISCDAVLCFLKDGIKEAMSRFNRNYIEKADNNDSADGEN